MKRLLLLGYYGAVLALIIDDLLFSLSAIFLGNFTNLLNNTLFFIPPFVIISVVVFIARTDKINSALKNVPTMLSWIIIISLLLGVGFAVYLSFPVIPRSLSWPWLEQVRSYLHIWY